MVTAPVSKWLTTSRNWNCEGIRDLHWVHALRWMLLSLCESPFPTAQKRPISPVFTAGSDRRWSFGCFTLLAF